MASRIFLEKHGNRLTLHAPDHPALDARAIALGGLRKGGAWSFPTNQEPAVSKLSREIFGTTGDDGGSKVTLRVDLSLFGEGSVGSEGAAWLAGRLLARRPSHDARVQLGEGVKLVRGGFGIWGGSRNHPALDARYGTVVDVEGVPRTAADLACQKYPITTAIVNPKEESVVGAWSKTLVTREAVVKATPPKAAPAAKAKAAAKAAVKTVRAAAKAAAKSAKAAAKSAKATAKSVVKTAKSVVKTVKAKVKTVKAKVKTKAKIAKAKTPKAAKTVSKAAAKVLRSARAAAKKIRTKVAKATARATKVAKAKTKPVVRKAKAMAKKAKAMAKKAKPALKRAKKKVGGKKKSRR